MKIRGFVEVKRVARGSKSEHNAVVLRAGERELWLRKRDGPAFGDASLRELVGKQLACEGTRRGSVLILDTWKELDMPAKRKAAAGARRARAKARPQRKLTAASAASALGASDAKHPIRHVVWLMLENRSFDHMLGSLEAVIPEIDGVFPALSNPGPNGQPIQQQAGPLWKLRPDPGHELDNVMRQLASGNRGFVLDYSREGASQKKLREVMAYFAVGQLPALHALARSFVVCDRWHCSVPGPTWTNRLFAMSGTSRGYVDMPSFSHLGRLAQVTDFTQPSVFRRLEQKGISQRIYHGDFPLALLLADRRRLAARTSFARFGKFLADAAGPEGDFPSFAFIEPDYLWPGANDDHPPTDVRKGQRLVATVYNALRANPELWPSTLLVVSYDEHGGFYDHVVPPEATPPDGERTEYDFKQLGVRVPALLISPRLAAGVCHALFDHTSILRMCQQLWELGDMGRRTASATSPLDVLNILDEPRDDTPLTVPSELPDTPGVFSAAAEAVDETPPLSGNEEALVALSDLLDAGSPALRPARLRARAAEMTSTFATETSSPAALRELARRRVDDFLARD